MAAVEDGDARSFSLPRPVALLNAFTSGCTSRLDPEDATDDEDAAAAADLDDDDGWPNLPSLEIWAVAGWKLVRGL